MRADSAGPAELGTVVRPPGWPISLPGMQVYYLVTPPASGLPAHIVKGVPMAHQGSLELLRDPVAEALAGSANPARLAYTWIDGSPRVVPILVSLDG
jgi:hypothetical protein